MWKDKWNVDILTNIHSVPAEGNFGDQHGEAVELVIVEDSGRQKSHCTMCTNLTAWYILTAIADSHVTGKMSYFSTFWTLPFITVLSFFLFVVQHYYMDWSG